MYKLVIVTDNDRAAGFRLAGAEVFEVQDPNEAEKAILPLLRRDDVGILAANEEYLLPLEETVMKKAGKLRRPLVIPIPAKSKEIDRRSYIERLLRRAIGYNIVLRR